MVLLAMVGMTIATMVLLGYPLLRSRPEEAAEEGTDELDLRKRSIYQDIKELEFDRETGKVAETDYESMRAGYEAEAAQVLEVMDRKAGKREEAGCPDCGEVPPSGARFCPSCGRELARFCPSCGRPAAAGDRFCGACGLPISAPESEKRSKG